MDRFRMPNKLIDLSHEVEHGMITYKGLPAPIICDYLSREDSRKNYAEGTQFVISKIEMVSNTGTYVDSPFHRFADGLTYPSFHWNHWLILREVLFTRRVLGEQSQKKLLKESM